LLSLRQIGLKLLDAPVLLLDASTEDSLVLNVIRANEVVVINVSSPCSQYRDFEAELFFL